MIKFQNFYQTVNDGLENFQTITNLPTSSYNPRLFENIGDFKSVGCVG